MVEAALSIAATELMIAPKSAAKRNPLNPRAGQGFSPARGMPSRNRSRRPAGYLTLNEGSAAFFSFSFAANDHAVRVDSILGQVDTGNLRITENHRTSLLRISFGKLVGKGKNGLPPFDSNDVSFIASRRSLDRGIFGGARLHLAVIKVIRHHSGEDNDERDDQLITAANTRLSALRPDFSNREYAE